MSITSKSGPPSSKNLTLLVNHIASTFVTVAEGGTWKPLGEEAQAWLQPAVTRPHTG
jgi:hypothetical protein